MNIIKNHPINDSLGNAHALRAIKRIYNLKGNF